MSSGKQNEKKAPGRSTSAKPPVRVAEVLDRIDDLAEEAAVLFDLSGVLSEFAPRSAAQHPRRILIDNNWVVPRRHVVLRVQRLLSERSIEARDEGRDLLMAEIADAK